MAKIIASVNVSHVPAIGAAWDTGKTETPYWAPVFKGFDFSDRKSTRLNSSHRP